MYVGIEMSNESEVDDLDLSTSFFMNNDEELHAETLPNPDTGYELLYEGGPADLTVYMAHILLFQYSVRHSLTSKALQELLDMMSVFVPQASLPKSVRQLKKFFVSAYSEQCPRMQKYCNLCQDLIGCDDEDEKCACDAGHSEFITIPVGPQIKTRLESELCTPRGSIIYIYNLCNSVPEVLKAVKTPRCPSLFPIRDIHDGRKYRELHEFVSQENLTLTVNTDGVALFKSSSVSMWPIWILINELPVSMR